MVDKEILSRKLSLLESYLAELRDATDINWHKYTSDPRAKAFVERYLHLAIESIFDIANHIISFQEWREPDNYRDIFAILCENKVINKNDLESLKAMASFRNILVHCYEKIDDEVVFGVFKKRLPDIAQFSILIKTWAAKQ